MSKTKKKTEPQKDLFKYESVYDVPVGFIDVPVEMIVKADWNYKNDDEDKSRRLTNSIRKHGFIQNVILRPLDEGHFEMVNGNHRLDSLYELGHDMVHAYNTGEISLKAAQRISIETNEFSFESDMLSLSKLIEGIKEEVPLEELVETMPFSANELEEMSKLSQFNWDEFGVPTGEGDGNSEQAPKTEQKHQIILQFTKDASHEQRAEFLFALEQFLGDYETLYWANRDAFDDML